MNPADYKLEYGADFGKTLRELGKDKVVQKYKALVELIGAKRKEGAYNLNLATKRFMEAAQMWELGGHR